MTDTTPLHEVKDDDCHEFNTGDDDLNLLLGLTADIALGKANMDTGVWWLATLEKVQARLIPFHSDPGG